MGTIKKLVNVVVMLYLIAAVLIYFDVLNVGQNTNPIFYPNFFLAGGIIMLVELITENLYIMTLKRGHVHTQNKINELKALLYDHKQEIQDIRKKKADDHIANTSVTSAPVTKPVTPAPDANVIVMPKSWSGIPNPDQPRPHNPDAETNR